MQRLLLCLLPILAGAPVARTSQSLSIPRPAIVLFRAANEARNGSHSQARRCAFAAGACAVKWARLLRKRGDGPLQRKVCPGTHPMSTNVAPSPRRTVPDGDVLPFSEVECDHWRSVHRTRGDDYARPDYLDGPRWGRVLAHELVYILTRSAAHGSDSVTQPAFSGRLFWNRRRSPALEPQRCGAPSSSPCLSPSERKTHRQLKLPREVRLAGDLPEAAAAERNARAIE